MSSQEYENDAQNLADKVSNKVNEFAGEAQQQFGDAVDSPKHQLKGAARNTPLRRRMPFQRSLSASGKIP
jgi:hypothetical protein